MAKTVVDKKPEIMSPAGNWISLRAALDAGCDAVYFGIKGINMRAGADNFSVAEMKRVTALCHKNNTKAYLAMNTVISEKDIPKIIKIIDKAKQAGVDAIICWDFSVITESLNKKIPVYLSTQMSVSNSSSILHFYNSFGIKRFVLARECSLKEIINIRKNLKAVLGKKAEEIEIEVFIHGAMCVSISGRCFLSQFQFNKSANIGECIQPCRREYLVTDIEEKHSFAVGSNYILSPKDLCTLSFIEKLIEAGIGSFKIEGRNRSPEYVGMVTSAYRKAVDFYFENRKKQGFKKDFEKLKKELLAEVEKVYNRGFSSGFFLGKPINEWTEKHGNIATTRKEYSGYVIKYYKKAGVAEVKIESNGFKKGDEIMFQGTTTGSFSQKAGSMEIEHDPISCAEKGTILAVKTERPVRAKDKLYVIKNIKQGSL